MNDLAKWLRRGVARQDSTRLLLSAGMFVVVAIVAASRCAAAPPQFSCDYNGNGVCDAANYTVWRDLLHTPGPLPNDSTPGWVDQSDYNYWKVGFGEIAGSGAVAATSGVPEPASWMLAASAMLMFAMRRRR